MERPGSVRALLNKRYNLSGHLKKGAVSIADYIIDLEDELQHLQRGNTALELRSKDVERLAQLIETVHGDEAYLEVLVEATELEFPEYGSDGKMTVTFRIYGDNQWQGHLLPLAGERLVLRIARAEKRKRGEAKG
jgi:uncharacterized protein YecE (DUF72 family)